MPKFDRVFVGRWLSDPALKFLTKTTFIFGILLSLPAVFWPRNLASRIMEDGFDWYKISAQLAALFLAASASFAVKRRANLTSNAGVRYNYSVESQVQEIVNILSLARESVIIFSGSFHSSVYSDIRVTRTLEALECKMVRLFHAEKDVDPESGEFIRICSAKNWNVIRVPELKQSHFIAVDYEHLRLEFQRDATKTNARFAVYYYDRPEFVRAVLVAFRDNILHRAPQFDLSSFRI